MTAGYSGFRAPSRAARVFGACALTLIVVTTAPAVGRADTGSWSPMGPSGGAVTILVNDPRHPEVLYAGTYVGGVFRSSDAGLHWERICVDLPYDPGGVGYPLIFSVAVDAANSDIVYVSTKVGVFRSTDGGVHVSMLPQPTVTGGTFNQLLANTARPGELFATNSAFSGYVYRSTDGGTSWQQYTQGMFGTVNALAVDGVGLCATTTTGFYRRGATGNWSRAGDAPEGKISDLVALGGTMYAATSAGFFVSPDGVTWNPVTLPTTGPIFRIGHDSVNQAYLVGRGELLKLAGGQPAAESVTTDFPFTACTGILTVNGTLIAATDMGIYRSDDAGVSWRPSHEGLVNTDALMLAADANDPDYMVMASGTLYDGGIYLTTDGGRTWSQRGQRLPNTDVRSIVIHPNDRNTLLAGTGNRLEVDGQNGGIWKSTDAGVTWRNVTVGDFPDEARLVIDIHYAPDDPNTVYACVVGIFQGFYKSTDGGETWTRKVVGLESMPPATEGGDDTFVNYFACLSMAIDPKDPQHIYMGQGGCWGAINVSFDGGEHWTRHSYDRGTPGMPKGQGLELFKIVIDPFDSNVVYASGRSEPPVGVYKTTDGGNSWVGLEPRITAQFLANGMAMDPTDHQRLYVATRLGVWTSANAGGHWTIMNEGMPKAAETGRLAYIHPQRPGLLLYGSAIQGLFSRQIGPLTPVALARFTATPAAAGGMELAWETAGETDHAGFHVYRAPHAASADPAGRQRLTASLLTGPGPGYRWHDATVRPGRWDYYLAAISRAGATQWFGPITAQVESAPPATPATLSAAPNPFARGTVLSFATAAAGRGELGIFDVTGRRVITLLDAPLAAGPHDISWDGRAADGTTVPAGAYFARFTAADGTRWTRKLSVTR